MVRAFSAPKNCSNPNSSPSLLADIPVVSTSKIQTAKLSCYPDTDSLYIDLSAKPSAESREVSEGVLLNYDHEGNVVEIDIDNASRKLDLSQVVTSHTSVPSTQ